MKKSFLLLLLGVAAVGNAWADRDHRRHFGVTIMPWGPWYYPPPPVYHYPRAYYPPPVYIERSAPPPAPATTNYWYYCESAKAYYPYVRECPGGWQKVAPQPPEAP